MKIHKLTTKSSPDAKEYPFFYFLCCCEERSNGAKNKKKIGKAAGNQVEK